ncbi:bidirectional sugar transporter NEC1-like [Juglans microcarpa x Juglans regia]|uniref:bidirectional sugar transporter NEC1-like n=1 Tax=Juglans microcarpa x Juglans regia TaxID=2249226 RepID=UPI001B7E1538|nr:bidirectional sugar transporter NEC1-like [Juglans microcarpa x Juglans regia]
MATTHVDHHVMSFVFGLLGNIVSFLVYLAPAPTFYRIYRKKSTQGFQSLPYSVALFSAMLTLYYALLKKNAFMLININSIGGAIESIYLVLFMIYAPGRARIYTAKLLILFNVGLLGLIILCTSLIRESSLRLTAVGWTCAICSVCVFAAPLSVMRLVIQTKSVEFMPFSLSFFLTICATMWFSYGLLIKDLFIATPNILGFIFGMAQMILYIIYMDRPKDLIFPEMNIQLDVPSGPATTANEHELQLSTTQTTEIIIHIQTEDTTQNISIIGGSGAGTTAPPIEPSDHESNNK